MYIFQLLSYSAQLSLVVHQWLCAVAHRLKKKKKKLCVHNDKDYLNHFFSFSLLFSLQNSVLTSSTLDFFFSSDFSFPQPCLPNSDHLFLHSPPTSPILFSLNFFFLFVFFFLSNWHVGVWVVDSNRFAGFCGSNRHVVCGRLWLVVAIDVLVVAYDGCYG